MIQEFLAITVIMASIIALYVMYEVYSFIGIFIIFFAMAFISVWLFPVVCVGILLWLLARYIIFNQALEPVNWWLKQCDLCDEKPIIIMMDKEIVKKMRCKNHLEEL